MKVSPPNRSLKVGSLKWPLLIDKPEGITSHDVVARVRRILGTKEVGHTGTLDPFGNGINGFTIGQATKLSDYLRDGDKGIVLKLNWV